MTDRRILICSYYLPQEDVDSFSRRLFHFVQFLREADWRVTCVADNPAGVERCALPLEDLGVSYHIGFDKHIGRLSATEHFDVALLGFWHLAERAISTLRRSSSATRVIVDSGDLHFLRHARRLVRARAGEEEILDPVFAAEMIRELNVYAEADAVFAVSRKEADFVNDFLGDPVRAYAVPDCEDLTRSPVPFTERRGMFFVGNFQHPPNVEAVKFLCRDILPQFPNSALADHPVYIAGNAMTEAVRRCAEQLPFVRMLGWIPSVQPYLERVRIALLPLLHGAGTKRKMIQSLSIGTPTVSTTIGIEGFDLTDEEDVLVADDPVAFANAMARLLRDENLWQRLARQGRDRILVEHSRQNGRERLLESLDAVLARPARPVAKKPVGPYSRVSQREYQEIIRQTRARVSESIPVNAGVLVVSKGDPTLLNHGDRQAWHFPRSNGGGYAGYNPANSTEAITQLEECRSLGGDYLVLPKTAFWWLDHYADFAKHLMGRYRLAVRDRESCVIFSLREPPLSGPVDLEHLFAPDPQVLDVVNDPMPAVANTTSKPLDLEALRPRISDVDQPTNDASPTAPRVMVVGVYLADRFNNIDDIVNTLSQSVACDVVQRWVALGGPPPTPRVARVTARTLVGQAPKFAILKALLADEPVDEFDYVLICDDDIVLPRGFLDRFVSLQSTLGFSIAQPALTPNSFVSHPIVERQRGTIARETQFVEIGPVVSVHRSAFDAVLPFDLASPMGWGYEAVWATGLREQSKCMGIIDAVPVDHSLRPCVSTYSWGEANRQRELILERLDVRIDDPFRVLGVATRRGADGVAKVAVQRVGRTSAEPHLSVVIPTRDRAALLDCSLRSLSRQSLPASDYEVIVVDDGSSDGTVDVCERWASHLPLTYLPMQPGGIAAAKNLGVFAARSPLIVFFDDDDVAEEHLLAEHLKTHARYPLDHVAVLGYTDWAPSLEISDVMRYVTNVGYQLFNYSNLTDGQRLNFTYFWGGRSSCKKSLLARIGVFRQEFEFGSEDIELGFRLSKVFVERRLRRKIEVASKDLELMDRMAILGLAVIFNRCAIQHMNRPLTYDDVCRRSERQGKSQWQFSRLHSDPVVHEWCRTTDAFDRWNHIRNELPAQVARVYEIEELLADPIDPRRREGYIRELHELYGQTFHAFTIKGIATAASSAGERPGRQIVDRIRPRPRNRG